MTQQYLVDQLLCSSVPAVEQDRPLDHRRIHVSLRLVSVSVQRSMALGHRLSIEHFRVVEPTITKADNSPTVPCCLAGSALATASLAHIRLLNAVTAA